MRRLGDSGGAARVYLTGGATAILRGWRTSTVDVDLLLVPDDDVLLRAIQDLKEELQVNVEIAGPSHFLPQVPGWELRSRFLAQEGKVHFYEYDLYSQVLAKIERAHEKDMVDVDRALADGAVERAELRRLFDAIEPEFYRFPALDGASFRGRLESVLAPRSD
jgi:hypothetical protein